MPSSKAQTTPLPISAANLAKSADRPPTTNRKIRVLVVDDSSTVRIAASRVFGHEFDVLLAIDGANALEILEKDPDIQVVFTDLVMPEVDGFELLKKLRTHDDAHINNLPVIVMTSAENPELAKQKAFSLGATDFVTKPFQATDMQARARSYAQLNLTTKLLKEQTTIDELTGASNLRGLKNQLERDIAFAAKHQCSLSLLTVEIDNYKNLFVSMGRSSAEKIIRRIGQTVINSFRKGDTVARTGLARFSVSMPLVKKENAMEIANKICQTVESFKARLNGKRLPLTVSAGIISFNPDESIGPDAMIDMAHKALIKAKELGTSQLYAATFEDFPGLRRRSFSIDALLEQIEDGNELVVADQLNDAVAKLAPLLSLLSNEQKQRLIMSHH